MKRESQNLNKHVRQNIEVGFVTLEVLLLMNNGRKEKKNLVTDAHTVAKKVNY